MSQAAIIHTPLVLPKGVTRKQYRLALLLPRAASAYEALLKAGYTPKTANGAAATILGGLGVAAASKAIEAAKRDSAKGIKRAVAPKVAAHVKDGMALQDALAIWATSAKIESDYPDEESAVGETEELAARHYARELVTTAYMRGLEDARSGDNAITPANIDAFIDDVERKLLAPHNDASSTAITTQRSPSK